MENPDDQFSLKWNNFQANLATGFHDLLQEEDMVDVTLAAEGKFVQAHKIILSVCSPYFRNLFKVNPCKHPIVILKDVGHQELSDMLDFMYRGEANVRQDDLPAFLKLADTLKVKGLAGDKTLSEVPLAVRKPVIAVKKKRIVEQTVFDADDDPGEVELHSPSSEPRRKRKRPMSPHYKTDVSSTDGDQLLTPKQETIDDVEFLEEASDPLTEYIKSSKHSDLTIEDESQLDINADETQDDNGDLSSSAAGPSNMDESTDQLPPGMEVCYLPASTRIVAVDAPPRSGTTQKIKSPASPIWNYFTRNLETRIAICIVCGSPQRIAHGTTSGLMYHLKSSHPQHHKQFLTERAEWQRLKDFYIYQNYVKSDKSKKVLQVVQMSDTTSAIIIDKK